MSSKISIALKRSRPVRGESVAVGIRQLARQQVKSTLAVMRNQKFSTELVNQVREGVEKLRAIFRLVSRETGQGHFPQEDRRLREARRSLSDIRNAGVLLKTFRSLVSHHGFDLLSYRELCEKLYARQTALSGDAQTPLRDVARTLQRLSKLLPTWELGEVCVEDLLAFIGGVYRRGRKSMKHYVKSPDPDRLQIVRKCTKDLGCQLWTTQEWLAPAVGPLAEQCGWISDVAGLARDYTMLRELVEAEASDTAAERLVVRIGEIEESISQAATQHLVLFYKDNPSRFLKQISPAIGYEKGGH